MKPMILRDIADEVDLHEYRICLPPANPLAELTLKHFFPHVSGVTVTCPQPHWP